MDGWPLISSAEQRVLNYLKGSGSSEVKGIALSLRVTPMAVRHHLAVLEKAGLVKITVERGSLGRPRYVYSLTAAADAFFPREYGELATKLIKTIARLDGGAKVARVFQCMKEEAIARAAPRMVGKSLRERVAEMATIMTEAGYMAEWQQLNARTFEITERNCAISEVAQQCHHACAAELAMMQELLNATVRRRDYILAGDTTCCYLIQAPPSHKSSRRRRRPSSRTRVV